MGHYYRVTDKGSPARRVRVSSQSSSSTDLASLPARTRFDRATGRFTAVVDVSPATIDEVSVAVGRARIRLTIRRDGTVAEGTISPPARTRRFTDDREARYNNGVLTIDVGTARVPRRR